MQNVILGAGVGSGDITDCIDFAVLDRGQLPWWIDALKEAETDVRRLRGQLEALLLDQPRHCGMCERPVSGRPDRRYCSATCRQRGRRAGIAPAANAQENDSH